MHPAAVRVHSAGGHGSGIAVMPDCVLTVYHLFDEDGADKGIVVDPIARGTGGSRNASLEYTDRQNDLAIVRVDRPLEHWVEVAGSPVTASWGVFYGGTSGVVAGQVNAARLDGRDQIRVHNRARSGDSGGGIFLLDVNDGTYKLASVVSQTSPLTKETFGASLKATGEMVKRCHRNRGSPAPAPKPTPKPTP